MKIIDAYWEKRNLGISTTEITIESQDKVEDFEEVVNGCESQYMVVRLPFYLSKFLFPIQNIGFSFVEDMITMKSFLNIVPMNSVAQRLNEMVTYERMNSNDIDLLINNVEEGLFDSDRIYCDPYFNTTLAYRRYANWIRDEIQRGSLFYKYIYKSNTIGFFSLKNLGNGNYDSFLSAFYKEFQKSGFGTVQKIHIEVKRLGGKSVTANVSSNNLRQIKSLSMNGFVPDNINHIFVKHKG